MPYKIGLGATVIASALAWHSLLHQINNNFIYIEDQKAQISNLACEDAADTITRLETTLENTLSLIEVYPFAYGEEIESLQNILDTTKSAATDILNNLCIVEVRKSISLQKEDGTRYQHTQTNTGQGVFLNRDYVLLTYHQIGSSEDSFYESRNFQITTSNGEIIEDIYIFAQSPRRDMALLRVNTEDPSINQLAITDAKEHQTLMYTALTKTEQKYDLALLDNITKIGCGHSSLDGKYLKTILRSEPAKLKKGHSGGPVYSSEGIVGIDVSIADKYTSHSADLISIGIREFIEETIAAHNNLD